MATSLDWWPSPAKLNLFLHINARLNNGYHALQSVFQLLDFGDKLAFEVNTSSRISMKTPIAGVKDVDNLIFRAAKALQEASNTDLGCDIYLEKVLPMGGGIGGGSSNAATTLVALNHLWQCHLSIDELADIGLSLGADVPIFVRGHSAFAEGVGEQITPLNLANKYYLVVFPGCHVSTGEIFTHPNLPRNTPKIRLQDYEFSETHNDCQKIVCERYPKVANLLHWLLEYAPSRMTGTGACLFSVFDTKSEAERVLSQLPEECTGFVAQGVNRSPLYAKLDEI
ncbi:4-(cytidine 5'-diphospho)-2-C-methyl-D-erythritol kinase [Aestuariibacter sp. AA17]|uniref:4-diphosphocytidyl-2-C-methyl-D-erythritol kinase n=1 Tax=Fluctibacter corallii TaxID=2984329 RepID=A0ABT3ADC6_9ALTE|nr:4-(cytidine 5'-diphospho)-2-C-methyl-D-erythritol kinase [Aestuariibacter sp. AA17]MCV2886668.1 4-(cytidine 5'-diphospho)-2-C-methyl-D-erythritol kinase [Aestuariibacter sp. AA17]